MCRAFLALLWLLLAIAFCPLQVPADDGAAAKVTFEQHVLPIFKAHCFKCHAGAEPAGGLQLTSRREILRGGKSGPAMRIAAAESSRIWELLAGNAMPKDGPPLTAEEKGVIRSWINDGAGSENEAENADDAANDSTASGERDHWSLRPVARRTSALHADPVVQQRLRSVVDAFIAERLTAKGLQLSADATAEIVARRAFFDLTGLPPSAAELDEFLNDDDPSALERLVDRLLASPHYGERWGRHWLDIAGYADSAGVLAEDRPIPNAFRYRDYVVRAMNADKPYDRFLQEQIAGDELSGYWQAYETCEQLPQDVIEGLIATGFLRCAPDSSRPDFSTIKNADAQYFYPTINDTLQILATSTMGMTLQCARCHNHKYDPISQSEYYQVQAIFMAAFRPKQWVPQMERRIHVASAAQRKQADEHNGKIDSELNRLRNELATLRNEFKTKLFEERLAALPEAIREDVRKAADRPVEQRSEIEKYLAEKFQATLRPDDATLDKVLPETYAEYRSGRDQKNTAIAAEERRRMHFDELRALYDLPGPVVTPLLRRGDALTPGPAVEPGVPSAIAVPFEWQPPPNDAKSSGRRLAFARWLTHPDHPLTSRVMANRVWLHHFGEGIVSTPEDFGVLGSPPSHPELLDRIAYDFVMGGWSVKKLHRQLMISTTYGQQSNIDPIRQMNAIQVDPENRLLWRQRLRRLDAESLRDSLLVTAGAMNFSMFGPAVPVARQPDGEVIVHGQDDARRSIYIQVLRSNPLSLLQVHDQPVMETNCVRRRSSTVSTQALTLLNSNTTVGYARQFAERACRESPQDPLDFAVRAAFARRVSVDEEPLLRQFLDEHQRRYLELGRDDGAARMDALADLCHMLMVANEFLYLD